MSQQYPGGLITKNPVVPSGPYENSSASGVWTMDQAAQYIKAGNWPTAGNLPNYIEDVFSTYLYTGNGSTQTITNGINLADEGGLVWTKIRGGSGSHFLVDTVRGNTKTISSNTDSQEGTTSTGITAFNSDGYALGSNGNWNPNTYTTVSWTFRKQAKFFDVVTYTGNGSNRTIAHNLGSVPGCIIVKRTDTTADWQVYHRSIANTEYLVLNSTAAKATGTTRWNSTTPTSTEFSLGTDTTVNANGGTYVAYLFAHDAGGFGLSGSDNVISCGIYTGNGSANGPEITLGYEPQWVLIKSTASAREWVMADVMRGMSLTYNATLLANQSLAEFTSTSYALYPTATGFKINTSGTNVNSSGATYIYIAIRRGPMKVPTSGTSVFSAKTYTATTSSATVTHDVTFDAEINANRTVVAQKLLIVDSLRGINGVLLATSFTSSESSYPAYWSRKDQRTMYAPSGFDDYWAASSGTAGHISYGLVRAPGFFDVVCDTGTGSAHTITHNLGAVPELMIRKKRSASDNWIVYANNDPTDYLILNSTAATADLDTMWNDTAPTASVFTVGTNDDVNQNTGTFVTYLFATLAGVSKVGSYTGTGTTKQIDCGFTGGARFILIKRTDSTGDWYVWDTARGIAAGNDPYLLLNSTAAEVTSTDYVDTYSAGFELSSTAPAALNANGGTYIFLAIA